MERVAGMSTEQIVSVWLDKTSDASEPVWVVSVDNEEGSDTLRWFDTFEKALAFGRAAAGSRELELEIPLYPGNRT